MRQKRCFFIGHRDAPSDLYPSILSSVEEHIAQHGVTEFLVGQYGAFDRMAAKAVIRVKGKYPDVKLILLLAYHPGEKKAELPDGFDGSLYPEGQETVPRRLAIVRANQYAVKHSGYLIAYAWQPGSNARKVVEGAGKVMHITIINDDSNQ